MKHLRTHLAGRAMQSLINTLQSPMPDSPNELTGQLRMDVATMAVARCAVAFADALIAELGNKGQI